MRRALPSLLIALAALGGAPVAGAQSLPSLVSEGHYASVASGSGQRSVEFGCSANGVAALGAGLIDCYLSAGGQTWRDAGSVVTIPDVDFSVCWSANAFSQDNRYVRVSSCVSTTSSPGGRTAGAGTAIA
jgi:hypothetical protein